MSAPARRPGLFVSLEGIEGVGKTTQVGTVAAWFRDRGHDVVLTREPGGTEVGEGIRHLLLHTPGGRMAPLTELLLVAAARAEHVERVLRPALDTGQVVVCDRYIDATHAYQGGGRALPAAAIEAVETLATAGVRPDLTLLLDAPVDVALGRARARGGADRFESERAAFFTRVRQAYLDRAAAAPDRLRVIDATRPLEAVTAMVQSALAAAFP